MISYDIYVYYLNNELCPYHIYIRITAYIYIYTFKLIFISMYAFFDFLHHIIFDITF